MMNKRSLRTTLSRCFCLLICLAAPLAATAQDVPADQEEISPNAFQSRVVDFDLHDTVVCAVAEDYSVPCYDFERAEGFDVDARLRTIDVISSRRGTRICGVQVDGTLKCVAYRLAADGLAADVPSGKFQDVQLWGHGACALDMEGEITCWGGIEEKLRREDGLAERLNLQAKRAAPAGPFESISLSYTTACALRLDGDAVCWSLPSPFAEQRTVRLGRPMKAFGVTDELVSGMRCGLRTDGGVQCWGKELSYGTITEAFGTSFDATFSKLDGDYVALSNTGLTVCGLRADGRVDCMMRGGVKTLALQEKVNALVVGRKSSCARTSKDGKVICWDTTQGPSQRRSFQ